MPPLVSERDGPAINIHFLETVNWAITARSRCTARKKPGKEPDIPVAFSGFPVWDALRRFGVLTPAIR